MKDRDTGRLLAWPSTLRARIFFILFVGLAGAYGLSFGVLYLERYMSAKAVMLGTLERDVATSIAVLDRLPVNERANFIDWLSRGNYRFVLGEGLNGVPDTSPRSAEIAARIEEAVDHRYPLRIEAIPGDVVRLQAHLTLSDGSPLTIDITRHARCGLAAFHLCPADGAACPVHLACRPADDPAAERPCRRRRCARSEPARTSPQ
jgi:hypothetical protein